MAELGQNHHFFPAIIIQSKEVSGLNDLHTNSQLSRSIISTVFYHSNSANFQQHIYTFKYLANNNM